MATIDLGGEGSGNFGHAGRPGEIGGSAAEGGGGDGGHTAPAPTSHSVEAPAKALGDDRPTPIVATDLSHAVDLILKGEVVELKDVGTVHTVLSKLAEMAKDAEAKGQEAPHYDLCKVSVAGSNLFCGSIVKTPEFPNGIPRIDMPQLTGKPVPGTAADELPKSAKGHIDAVGAFMEHLSASGITVTETTKPAASLKATQMELVGPTVAAMMANTKYDPGAEPIFVSSDGYVLDGHHRWAAVVGRDAKDGHLGESKMHVRVVDAPISELLLRANNFVKTFGIAAKAGKKKTALAMIFDGDVILLPFREKLMKLSEKWTPES